MEDHPLVSTVQERVAELNSGKPSMDSAEELFRTVLAAIAAGAENAAELAHIALKAR